MVVWLDFASMFCRVLRRRLRGQRPVRHASPGMAPARPACVYRRKMPFAGSDGDLTAQLGEREGLESTADLLYPSFSFVPLVVRADAGVFGILALIASLGVVIDAEVLRLGVRCRLDLQNDAISIAVRERTGRNKSSPVLSKNSAWPPATSRMRPPLGPGIGLSWSRPSLAKDVEPMASRVRVVLSSVFMA